jgi:hypothetical protein
VAGYPQYPADLGPGMIESPTQPGRLVMDPRFLNRRSVMTATKRPARSSSIRRSACSIWWKGRVERSATA